MSFVPDEKKAPGRSTGADVAIGAGKSVGRNLLDLGVAAANFDPVSNAFLGPLKLIGADKALGIDKYLPGYVPPGTREALAPENQTQRNAGWATDAAMALAGPGIARGAANLVRSGAKLAERSALPMSDAAAEFTLKNMAGRVAPKNSAALATEATPRTLPGGVKVQPKPHVQEAAAAMEKAVNTPGKPFWEDFAVGSGAYALGGPKVAGTIAALKFLNRPAVKSGIAQVGYSTAPVLGATGVGVAAPIVSQVLDWLTRSKQR